MPQNPYFINFFLHVLWNCITHYHLVDGLLVNTLLSSVKCRQRKGIKCIKTLTLTVIFYEIKFKCHNIRWTIKEMGKYAAFTHFMLFLKWWAILEKSTNGIQMGPEKKFGLKICHKHWHVGESTAITPYVGRGPEVLACNLYSIMWIAIMGSTNF